MPCWKDVPNFPSEDSSHIFSTLFSGLLAVSGGSLSLLSELWSSAVVASCEEHRLLFERPFPC